MKKVKGYLAAGLSVALLTSGCATAGGISGGGSSNQLSNTVVQTHRMVQNMEQNLTGSVSTLTRTTAEIAARLNTNEQETRRLLSMAEENQRKLDTLQYSLDDLIATLYKEMNLTPPTRVTMPTQPRIGTTPDPLGPPQTTPQPFVTRPDDGPTITPPPTLPPSIDTAPPGTQTPNASDASAHYRQAQESYTNADYATALQQFDEHIRLHPDSPHLSNATYWRAHCYFKMGDYTQAVQRFGAMRSQYPTSEKVPIAMYNEGVAYSRLGNIERAKVLFQQLIREYPDDVATEVARDNLRQLQGLSQ
ncbi:MAG: tol-pal system protein YbgF [Candidatus Hydrogenedentota bacterium]